MKKVSKSMSKSSISIVIPSWNEKDALAHCLDSLLEQTRKAHIIVVENGSVDGSLQLLQEKYPQVEIIVHTKNLGFTGGVNAGIRRAIERKDDFVALFNNDAVADKNWLDKLAVEMEKNDNVGIATCTLMSIDEKHLDSTGDIYTVWGLPFPRGRGEAVSTTYDKHRDIFGASGGASIFRVKMLEQIGIFDDDFFAYYEDVDISFRAQLAGWKVRFAPKAKAYHQIGATSGKIKGFTTYQTMKNLPWVIWKDVPTSLLPKVLPRFCLAYTAFWLSAVRRGQGWSATRGWAKSLLLLPKKLGERRHIQRNRTVSVSYIWSIMEHDLPPNAHKLRKLRSAWWKVSMRRHA